MAQSPSVCGSLEDITHPNNTVASSVYHYRIYEQSFDRNLLNCTVRALEALIRMPK